MLFHSLFPHHICQRYVHIDDEKSSGLVPLKLFAGALAAQLLNLADIEEEKELTLAGRKRAFSDVNNLSEESDSSKDRHHEEKGIDIVYTYTMTSGKKLRIAN